MLDKLASVEAQYNYLMGLIADPAVQSDAQAYKAHTKTLSELQELVDAYRSLKSLEEQLAQARELVSGADADMAALAREELAELEPQHATLLEHVKFLLIPKDPNDAKNVVLLLPQLRHRSFQGRLLDVREDDLHAFLRESRRHRQADTAGAAGDHRDLALEVLHVGALLFL